MKNKTLKKTLLISTGLLAAGGICIGIGLRWEEARCFIWITKEFI